MEFRQKDVIRILDLKPSRLQAWLEAGWIRPSIQQAEGQGTPNIYSRGDLFMMQVFKECVELGISRKLMGAFVEQVARTRFHRTPGNPTGDDQCERAEWMFLAFGNDEVKAFFADKWPEYGDSPLVGSAEEEKESNVYWTRQVIGIHLRPIRDLVIYRYEVRAWE